jgi:hypothetical protein
MKDLFRSLKDTVSAAAANRIEAHRPGTLAQLNEVGRNVAQHTAGLRQVLDEKATDAKELAQRVASDERTRRAVDRVSAGLDSVRQGIATTTSSVASSVVSHRAADVAESASPVADERGKTTAAIEKLSGRDKVGVSAEVLGAAGGAAAGAAAAGTVAGMAGATTLLGSTGLASALGGIFAVSTPVGWVVGAAVLAGAAGYGLTRLARSGAQQDRTRQEIIARLIRRLESPDPDSAAKAPRTELAQLITDAVEAEVITETQGRRMVSLVEHGSLSVEVAVKRLKDLAMARSTIEPVDPT